MNYDIHSFLYKTWKYSGNIVRDIIPYYLIISYIIFHYNLVVIIKYYDLITALDQYI